MAHVLSVLESGVPVQVLTLGQPPGLQLSLLDLGATVHQLHVTCGDGIRRNLVLGHATAEEYCTSSAYLGGTIGRYANRIARGRFSLDGSNIELATHDRGNHLHGGPDGFDKRLWSLDHHDDSSALFSLTSPDGDQGFPGRLRATASFAVEPDRVRIELTATANAATVVNLTNHAYFNLAGEVSGTIDDHDLHVGADFYTPVDGTGVPLGMHAPVAGTPFDLRAASRLGEIVRSSHPQIATTSGIDHNYVLSGSGMRLAAVLRSSATMTQMELATDQPGLQVYTGNSLSGRERSTSGSLLRQGDGIALEPQLFPDSPNRPEWPSPIVRPGQTYVSRTTWRFTPLERA